jgi:hypothetical protein
VAYPGLQAKNDQTRSYSTEARPASLNPEMATIQLRNTVQCVSCSNLFQAQSMLNMLTEDKTSWDKVHNVITYRQILQGLLKS